MSDQDAMANKKLIWDNTDFDERMAVAKELGIRSRQTISNLFHHNPSKRTKNIALLKALIEKAEQNRAVIEKAKNDKSWA